MPNLETTMEILGITNVYICADGTLTYGPYGGKNKIIPQALPIGVVDSPEKAERLIQLVGSKAYPTDEDADFSATLKGDQPKPGYGPSWRYRYSWPEFRFNDWESVFDVRKRMEEVIKTL
jgi:hypothetical protein